MIAATPLTKSEQMAAELKAQEIRGMDTYATDEPSENWSPAFWKKFSLWSDELAAYERQELAGARPHAALAETEGS